ncbi:hypothetical protein IW140_005124 [Coemansia sp. RSA 1813]|nr:hypothetical protein EV178_005924 [Coemansia sp. RSA 1646]KAJ1767475.1 hypothetical protein LPJ74_005342 [Coemansia sp. RSA 1843]KAJ2087174.1 hypothetical protein IW138_005161 [Coemansia sp. RSA 986]KAJ2211985.1 hypothetical protein EV179_005029 [Coemansia sp. RSA 487]KAJ2565969.1 hypothetical protein IW140_005124 [Coemansia sp. RSA 1813]
MFSRTGRIVRSTAPKTRALSKTLYCSSQQRHMKTTSSNNQNAAAAAAAATDASLVPTPIHPSSQESKSINRLNYSDVVMPSVQTKEQLEQKAPLMRKISALPLVHKLVNSNNVVREEFYWPIGKRRLVQAPETLAYGALSGSKDLPLSPLVFRWKSGGTPSHLNAEVYSDSFQNLSERSQWANARVPGITSVQYLGSNLSFSNAGSCASEAHLGMPSALLDEITARVSISNTPNKPTFTANFQLEYIQPVPVDSFIELNAWVTRIEGRKAFIASYVADALSGQVLVKAKSLFVSAA